MTPSAVTTTKTCRKCLAEQPKLLEVCECGQEFVDVRDHRIELEMLLGKGSARIILGATLGIAATLFSVASGRFILLGGFMWGIYLIVKGFMLRADARDGLRELERAKVPLPAAKLLR